MAFAIRFTGDFLRECVFNSRTSALDQARRLTRLARLLAICPSPAAVAAMLPSIAERMQDEKHKQLKYDIVARDGYRARQEVE